MNSRSRTRDITFIAAGIALFVALSMCLRVPVFENYYLCLGARSLHISGLPGAVDNEAEEAALRLLHHIEP